MRFMWLLGFLICVGCATAHFPPYVIRTQHIVNPALGITQSGYGYNDYETFLYTKIFLELWAKESFPQNPRAVADMICWSEIHWQKDVFNYINPYDGNTKLLGLTIHNFKPPYISIFIATHYYGKTLSIEHTAYGHELIHIMLGTITGDAHPEHFRADGDSKWPALYEDFLEKVAIEYQHRFYENTRTHHTTQNK